MTEADRAPVPAGSATPAIATPALSWSPAVAGALAAAALTFVLLTFGAALGLSIASPSPTWRDASIALAFLSGLFVLLTAVVSFGVGGYVAGRLRARHAGAGPGEAELWDGVHGLLVWGLAVALERFSRRSPRAPPSRARCPASARRPRRPPNR